VSHWNRNPQRFAIEEMNEAFNSAGRFSHFARRGDLAKLRLRLSDVDGLRLAAWLRDLDGDVSSVFVDDASGATFYLREWRCGGDAPCATTHGALDVTARTHQALCGAVALVERLAGSDEAV
jgi:hypothetical protein